MRRAALAAAVLAAWAPEVHAQAPAAAPSPRPAAAPRAPARPAALARRIDAILDRPALAPATWGVEVREIATGRVLYARNAAKNMKPASTLKVVTTAAALDAFGPQERFRTTVETTGRIDGLGRVVGDLLLVGGGDPNLSGRFHEGRPTAPFEDLAQQLLAAGVRSVEGRVVGHEGLFAGERRGEDWSWGDLVWCYGAEVSALSFNDNCVDLQVSAGERDGDAVVVTASPPSKYYEIASTATTVARSFPGELRLERRLGGNVIRISGTHAIGQGAWRGSVALEDPARYAATVFTEVLAAKGIAVTGDAATSSDPLPASRRGLAAIQSQPLSELIRTINKESQNLHTETLLRLLGARRSGLGTVEAGREAVDDFLRRMGARPDTWSLQDGSGLSRSDLLTPRDMVTLLVAMDRHPHAAFFRDSLPVAGEDGTLESRMRGTPAAGRVQAKTGSIRNVNALAGYVTTRTGARLAFYAVSNHHESSPDAVAAIDALTALLGFLVTPVSIDAALVGKIRLGVAEIDGVTVREADPALAAETFAAGTDFRARHPGASSGDVPGVEDARGLYKAVGLDPTKTRPSNEALLRRVLKGEGLYTVNTLVDALNLSSLREQVPFGLYDLDRVEPPVVLRRGAPGESYEGIRKGPVNVDGRPVLVDARGPFGNPTSDSARTMITTAARRALVIAFAPATCAPSRLEGIVARTAEALVRFNGGAVTGRQIV